MQHRLFCCLTVKCLVDGLSFPKSQSPAAGI